MDDWLDVITTNSIPEILFSEFEIDSNKDYKMVIYDFLHPEPSRMNRQKRDYVVFNVFLLQPIKDIPSDNLVKIHFAKNSFLIAWRTCFNKPNMLNPDNVYNIEISFTRLTKKNMRINYARISNRGFKE